MVEEQSDEYLERLPHGLGSQAVYFDEQGTILLAEPPSSVGQVPPMPSECR